MGAVGYDLEEPSLEYYSDLMALYQDNLEYMIQRNESMSGSGREVPVSPELLAALAQENNGLRVTGDAGNG